LRVVGTAKEQGLKK